MSEANMSKREKRGEAAGEWAQPPETEQPQAPEERQGAHGRSAKGRADEILREISAMRRRIESLEQERLELSEKLYLEQQAQAGGADPHRAQEITKLLRAERGAKEDAAAGQIRQMRQQLAMMGQTQKS